MLSSPRQLTRNRNELFSTFARSRSRSRPSTRVTEILPRRGARQGVQAAGPRPSFTLESASWVCSRHSWGTPHSHLQTEPGESPWSWRPSLHVGKLSDEREGRHLDPGHDLKLVRRGRGSRSQYLGLRAVLQHFPSGPTASLTSLSGWRGTPSKSSPVSSTAHTVTALSMMVTGPYWGSFTSNCRSTVRSP